MKALILAAGVGKRLGEHGLVHPKCLLEFNGKSLLERHLEYLRDLQIEQVSIAVGYQADSIEAKIKPINSDGWIKTVYNPDYTQGSIVSLWTLREYLTTNNNVLLMDADVLYDLRILERLVTTKIPNCFLLDRNFIPGDEPVKLCVRNNYLVEFRKQVASDLIYDLWGESVGFFRFNGAIAHLLVKQIDSYLNNGKRNEPYEEIIRDLLLENPTDFGYEDITGLPWIEIDFPEDIQRAKNQILPQCL